MRAALGAGRNRLVRLLLTESLRLALLAGAAGLVMAYVAMQFLMSMEPVWIPRRAEIAIDASVLAAAGVATLGCGLLIGLASILVLRGTLSGDRVGVRASPERRAAWVRSGLVATQLALSVVLLTGSALVVRSYASLLAIPIGIDYRNVVRFALPGGAGTRVGPADPVVAAQLQQYQHALEYVQAILVCWERR